MNMPSIEEIKMSITKECLECRERIKALEVKMNIISYLSGATFIVLLGVLIKQWMG